MSTRKKLITNFSYLSSITALNYILPLITFPYLVRVLGPEKIGLLAFAGAFVSYFALLADYGFNMSAPRKISIMRDDKEAVSRKVSSVFIIKLGILFASFFVLFVICSLIPLFRKEFILYIIVFTGIVGGTFNPTWYFQGIERMKNIAILSVVGRAITVPLIFILVKKEADYLMVSVVGSASQAVVGIIALSILYGKHRLRFIAPGRNELIAELKDGWHIFLSTIAISLYTRSNAVILGIFTNNMIVGYYSAGEKIVRVVQGLLSPLSQTVYPHISKLASESGKTALVFIRKLVKVIGFSTLILSLALLIFAPQINNIILGGQYKESIPVIRILSFLPFIIGMSNIFGIQTMLNFGLKKNFTKIIISAGLINIFLAVILVIPFQHIGISISVIITESCVTFCMLFSLQRNELKIFKSEPILAKN